MSCLQCLVIGMSHKIEELLRGRAAQVDKVLYELLDLKKTGLSKAFYDTMRYYIEAGGKRLRPSLCFLAGQAVGKRRSFLRTSATMELFHISLLVHDDAIGNVPFRRGRPSFHKLYGIPMAINIGNGMTALALEVVIQSAMTEGSSMDSIAKMVSCIARMSLKLAEGQFLERSLGQGTNEQVSLNEKLMVMRNFSAANFSMPLAVGGILSEGTDAEIKVLEEVGENIGVIFRIQDDLLDLGTADLRWAKTWGLDLREGRRTFPVVYGLEKAGPKDKSRLIEILDYPHRKTDSMILEAISILKKVGAIGYSRKFCTKMVEKTRELLEKLPETDARGKISYLIEYLAERTY